ncbi:hypothetical protein QZH41_014457, partial [Actinostola sp. cb2023]
WSTTEWRPCSTTCGGGLQTRQIVCRQEIADKVHEVVADASCSGSKPTGDVIKACNEIACPEQWLPTTWSKCSVTCGGGTKSRSLMCMRRSAEGKMVLLHPSLCSNKRRPLTSDQCNQEIQCPIPTTEPPPKIYEPLGCYSDGSPRAIPDFVLDLRNSIDWINLNKTVDACAEYVRSEFPQNKVFSIQFYGECWTGITADMTYTKYGISKQCAGGVGGQKSFYAYRFR